jgi:hypothetical protein
MEIQPLFVATGFGVGLAVGLTGIGGGALMTPILVLGFGINAVVAVGTDLVYAAVTKTGGACVYHYRKLVRWPVVRDLLYGSIPASIICLMVLYSLPGDSSGEGLLRLILGAALVLSSLALLFRSHLQRLGTAAGNPELRRRLKAWRPRLTTALGALLGVLVTLTSVGAGALGTAFLLFLYPRIRMANLVGTDLAHAVILATIAGAGHWHLGTVDTSLLVALLVGSLPGVFIGSTVGARLPEQIVRPVVATALLLVGIHLVF